MTQRLAEQDKDLPLQDADDGKSSDENSEDDNSSDKEHRLFWKQNKS